MLFVLGGWIKYIFFIAVVLGKVSLACLCLLNFSIAIFLWHNSFLLYMIAIFWGGKIENHQSLYYLVTEMYTKAKIFCVCVCSKVDDFGSGFKVTIVRICHTVILSDTYQLTFLGNGARLGLEQIFLCALLNDLGTLLSDYVCMFWRVVAYFNCFQISLKLHIDVVL